jgi:hypothetical protein
MQRITIGILAMAVAASPFTVEGGVPVDRIVDPFLAAGPSFGAAGSEMPLSGLDDSFHVWQLVTMLGLSELASLPQESLRREELMHQTAANESESEVSWSWYGSSREYPWDDWESRELPWDDREDQDSLWDVREDRESSWSDWDYRDSPWDY